jgi:hypothetical protein
VGEDGGDGEAAGALDVHEERARSRHKGLKLVLTGLSLRSRVEKVDRENLVSQIHQHIILLSCRSVFSHSRISR